MKFVYVFFALVAMIVGWILVQMLAPLFGNVGIFDTTYQFDKAIIELPDGNVISGKGDKWNDYEGDVVQVKIGGKTYLTQYSRVVLISE